MMNILICWNLLVRERSQFKCDLWFMNLAIFVEMLFVCFLSSFVFPFKASFSEFEWAQCGSVLLRLWLDMLLMASIIPSGGSTIDKWSCGVPKLRSSIGCDASRSPCRSTTICATYISCWHLLQLWKLTGFTSLSATSLHRFRFVLGTLGWLVGTCVLYVGAGRTSGLWRWDHLAQLQMACAYHQRHHLLLCFCEAEQKRPNTCHTDCQKSFHCIVNKKCQWFTIYIMPLLSIYTSILYIYIHIFRIILYIVNHI